VHLNDAGQVTGYYADKNFTAHAYLHDTNSTFTTLNEPGQGIANAINASGNIVGVDGGKYSGRKDGFLREPNGTSVKIEYPGASTIIQQHDSGRHQSVRSDHGSIPAHHQQRRRHQMARLHRYWSPLTES